MREQCPRIVIAGMGGDSGKTLLSLGLLSSWRRNGLRVAPFKKGPDYIDAAWLSRFSGQTCRNLDTFLMGAEAVRTAFSVHARGFDAALVEGNRGVFDGLDARGLHSTAQLAELIDAPVLLILPVRKVTRTAASWVAGVQAMAPQLAIAGVVLNRVAGERHERVVRESIEGACGVPVLGALPVAGHGKLLADRHLGLVTPAEHRGDGNIEDELAALVESRVDCGAVLEAARQAPAMTVADHPAANVESGADGVRIGYFRDTAFTFYYPENLEALEQRGAELVPLSSLETRALPDIDALYIGGGFPETHAAKIAGNGELFASLAAAVGQGLPVYAECGGLIYLSRRLRWQGREHDMAGILAVDVELGDRPAGHGYQVVTVDAGNPFFEVGTELTGHEFHYSRVVRHDGDVRSAFAVQRGTGAIDGRDGLTSGNVLATYLHLHARGGTAWAEGLVRAAQRFRRQCRREDKGNEQPED